MSFRDDGPSIHFACLGEWQCGEQKMILSRQEDKILLEMGSGSQTRYIAPLNSMVKQMWPMRWAATRNRVSLSDPAPEVEDTLYILELPSRASTSLFVRRPSSEKSVEFTRPGHERSASAPCASSPRRRARSQSRTRSRSKPAKQEAKRGPNGWVEGDWICDNCEAHNFRRKISCYECSAWKPGCTPAYDDWICDKCGSNNFRKAMSCRSCAAPRPGSENNSEAALKETLVSQLKKKQRQSPEFKKRWYEFCDRYAGGFYDPVRHELRLLKHFLDLEERRCPPAVARSDDQRDAGRSQRQSPPRKNSGSRPRESRRRE